MSWRFAVRPVAFAATVSLIALVSALPSRALAAEPTAAQSSPVPAGPEDTTPRTAEEKELAWARAYGGAQDIGTALVAVAHSEVRAGEPQRAIETLIEALGIASQMHDDGLALGAAMTMADAYHALREFDVAERWVELAHAHRDRLPGRFEALDDATAAAMPQEPTEDAEPAVPSAPQAIEVAKPAPATATTVRPGAAPDAGPPRAAVPLDAETLDQGMHSARWLLLLFVVLLAGLLWVMLRRGSKLASQADRAAREQQLLASVSRSLRKETGKGTAKNGP